MYTFDMSNFWKKTVRDIATVRGRGKQRRRVEPPTDPRAVCNIAVGNRLCGQARPDWGAAVILVPWYEYLFYGDRSLIDEQWSLMTGWMAFLHEKALVDGLIQDGYGDWCPPGGNDVMDTPPTLTSTALYYKCLLVMDQLAGERGEQALAASYEKQAKAIRESFNEAYYDSAAGDYGTQTGTSIALHVGLVPEGQEQRCANGLASLIMEEASGRYTTGILGHRPLYTQLNDHGHESVTAHLWSLTDWPSLGFMTEQHGLTTWPERPLNWTKGERYRNGSFNHPMHSGFAAAFFESLGGIRPDPDNPGFKNIIFQPTFLEGLDWARVDYDSIQGPVKSHWKRKEDQVTWDVTAPSKTTAELRLRTLPLQITSDGKPAQYRVHGKVGPFHRVLLDAGDYCLILKDTADD
jgi:alpha-L-rhamnosidase